MNNTTKDLREYGSQLREIETIKSHKVLYYPEDEVKLLLYTLVERAKQIKILNDQVVEYNKRSADYLEIYKKLNNRLEEQKRIIDGY